jgi:hypothetical protein
VAVYDPGELPFETEPMVPPLSREIPLFNLQRIGHVNCFPRVYCRRPTMWQTPNCARFWREFKPRNEGDSSICSRRKVRFGAEGTCAGNGGSTARPLVDHVGQGGPGGHVGQVEFFWPSSFIASPAARIADDLRWAFRWSGILSLEAFLAGSVRVESLTCEKRLIFACQPCRPTVPVVF